MRWGVGEVKLRVDERGFVWCGDIRLPCRVVKVGEIEFPVKGRTQRAEHGKTISVAVTEIERVAEGENESK